MKLKRQARPGNGNIIGLLLQQPSSGFLDHCNPEDQSNGDAQTLMKDKKFRSRRNPARNRAPSIHEANLLHQLRPVPIACQV
jgi:hypothetical protein